MTTTQAQQGANEATIGAVASTAGLGAECTCGHILANGAYGGWYCAKHQYVEPAWYAVDAARELHAKYLAAANELYAMKRQAPNVEFSGTPAALSPEAPLERQVVGCDGKVD